MILWLAAAHLWQPAGVGLAETVPAFGAICKTSWGCHFKNPRFTSLYMPA